MSEKNPERQTPEKESERDTAKKIGNSALLAAGDDDGACPPPPPPPGEIPTSKAEKIIAYTDRIDAKTFRNANGFPNWLLERCDEYVLKKRASLNEKDIIRGQNIFEVASEPIIANILNGVGVTPGLFSSNGQVAAMWASEYDDLSHSTDIVCMTKSNKGWVTYSIDATTAANTSKDSSGVAGKFAYADVPSPSALKSPRGNNDSSGKARQCYSWANEIVFCKNGSYRYSEDYAPHYVIGLSRETFSEIANSFDIDNVNKSISGFNLDSEVEFMILSEFFEETWMQLANYKGISPMMEDKIAPLYSMVKQKLMENLGVEKEDFGKAYTEKVNEMYSKDSVYKNIVMTSGKYRRRYSDLRKK